MEAVFLRPFQASRSMFLLSRGSDCQGIVEKDLAEAMFYSSAVMLTAS